MLAAPFQAAKIQRSRLVLHRCVLAMASLGTLWLRGWHARPLGPPLQNVRRRAIGGDARCGARDGHPSATSAAIDSRSAQFGFAARELVLILGMFMLVVWPSLWVHLTKSWALRS